MHLTKPTPTCTGEQKCSFANAAGKDSWFSNNAGDPNSWFTSAVGEPNSLVHLWVSCLSKPSTKPAKSPASPLCIQISKNIEVRRCRVSVLNMSALHMYITCVL